MAGVTSFLSRCWMVWVVVKYLWLCYWRSWYSIFIFTISLSTQRYIYLIWEKDICEEIKKRYLWPTRQPVWVKLNRCNSLDTYIYSLKLMLPVLLCVFIPFLSNTCQKRLTSTANSLHNRTFSLHSSRNIVYLCYFYRCREGPIHHIISGHNGILLESTCLRLKFRSLFSMMDESLETVLAVCTQADNLPQEWRLLLLMRKPNSLACAFCDAVDLNLLISTDDHHYFRLPHYTKV